MPYWLVAAAIARSLLQFPPAVCPVQLNLVLARAERADIHCFLHVLPRADKAAGQRITAALFLSLLLSLPILKLHAGPQLLVTSAVSQKVSSAQL